MAQEKICGIYCIENLVNGKKYIGQSVNIYKRWSFHRWELKANCHPNTHLQRSWNKYGKDNFIFKIVEICPQHELNDKEMFWINHVNSHKNGYNLTDGGEGCLRKEWTDEQIEGISKPVFQIDLDGNIVKRWSSIKSAAKKLNINHRQIWNCANKYFSKTTNRYGKEYMRTAKTTGGYIWVYEKDIKNFNINDYIDTRSTSIRQYDLDWNLIKQWPSAKSTNIIGYGPTTIIDVCKGKFKQAYGYIWTYDDVDIDLYTEWYNDHFDIKYIGQYDLNQNLIKIWNTPKETEHDGFRAGSVRLVLNGKSFSHYGYIFKYIPWRELKNINTKGENKNEQY